MFKKYFCSTFKPKVIKKSEKFAIKLKIKFRLSGRKKWQVHYTISDDDQIRDLNQIKKSSNIHEPFRSLSEMSFNFYGMKAILVFFSDVKVNL